MKYNERGASFRHRASRYKTSPSAFRSPANLFAEKRKRISANTHAFFPKYADVFPQIFLRICGNKFCLMQIAYCLISPAPVCHACPTFSPIA